MLEDFLEHQNDNNELFFNFHSFFNIESGSFAIGSFNVGECDKCSWSSLENNTTSCDVCLRNPNNYLVGIAGDGDGVYTVWEIWDAKYRTIGILAIFDSVYATATSVRETLESGESPIWDDDFVADFLHTKRMVIGTLEETSILMIGETGLKDDTRDAIINILTGEDDDSDFEVSYFVEEPGKQAGDYPSENTYKPRVALVLRDEYKHLAGSEEVRGSRVDWAEQEVASLSNIVASHLEPMGMAAAYGNFLNRLVDLKDCVAKGSPQAIIEEAKRFAGVWALFLEFHTGDTEASDTLKSLGFTFREEDYGQMLALACISDDKFRFGGANTSITLTKSNALVSDDSSPAGPKFCGECGAKRPGTSKFCPECGTGF